MPIKNGIICIFHVFCFVYFWTNDSLHIMASLSMTSSFLCKSFFTFELKLRWTILVQDFIVIGDGLWSIQGFDLAKKRLKELFQTLY